jgi:sensor histidine kinase regulating citrate/malate metabolism
MALTISAGSHLSVLDPALSTDVITLLGNLIDNAVDLSEGSIAALVTVHIDDAAGMTVSVTDSGPGVPTHLREEIFARGVTSKPDVPGGRGVGLALVRLVSAQSGGTVEVTDAPSGGACLRVQLPPAQLASHA